MRNVQVVVTLAVILGALAPLRADEVQLKGGKTVKGIVIEEGKTYVRILTSDGKKLKLNRSDIELVAESTETGDAETDAKLKEGDDDDPNYLVEIAKWARGEKKDSWEVLALMAVRKDATLAAAHELLGHEKVGDTWYTDKRKAEKARSEAVLEEMKEKGYIRWRGGWISKDDRILADKDPKSFLKDKDGIWRSEADVRRAEGFELIDGKWVKAGTEQDKSDIKRFKELLGQDIWVITTKHFRLFVQQYSPDRVDEFGKLAEDVYAWFLKEMGKPADFDLFRGNQAHLWVFKDRGSFGSWISHYQNTYGFDADTVAFFSKGSGNAIHSLVGTITPNQTQDIRNMVVHQVGHFLIRFFSRGLKGTPPWLVEAVANHAEHVHCGIGQVTCVTKTAYGGDGGRAEKQFSTKDAKTQAKRLVREGTDEPFESLNKLDLNSLSGDHLAKGWAMIDWLWTEHHAKFVEYLEELNRTPAQNALKKLFDWTMDQIDKEWHKHAKGSY